MGVPICPDCQRRLEGGFLLEHTSGGYQLTQWVSGAPVRSRWLGLKLKGQRQLDMYAWRCPSCFQVRFYAPDA